MAKRINAPEMIPGSKPLPSGGTSNSFGVLMENIYSHQEKISADVVNSIYDELTLDGTPRTTGTGSPRDTGTLRANWNVGIRPNLLYIPRPTNGQDVPFVSKKAKTYGTKERFYIWNNTPYLALVNSGDTRKGKGTFSPNIQFIEKAIRKGEEKAGLASNVKLTGRASASSKILNMPFV